MKGASVTAGSFLKLALYSLQIRGSLGRAEARTWLCTLRTARQTIWVLGIAACAGKNVLGRVISIDVSGNEIDGDLFAHGVGDKTIHPGGLGGGGTADAQPGIRLFERARGCIVKLVVGFFARIAGPETEVRLVPNLEIPLGDFVDPVAIDKMLRELSD